MYVVVKIHVTATITLLFSRDENLCVIGHVEDGVVHNSSTFLCNSPSSIGEWMEYTVDVNSTHGSVTVRREQGPSFQSYFTPHFDMSPMGGPMILNSDVHYDFLEFGFTDIVTGTVNY